MTRISIRLVDKVVELGRLFGSSAAFFQDFLCQAAPDFSVTITHEDIAFERVKAAREDEVEGLPVRYLTDEQLEITALQRKITEHLFDYDTLLFHGSVVAVDGVGYLFTAKSGTGKSTHTRLWREVFGSRAVMVNDDKPFLQILPEGVVAHGSPWMGKHGLGANISVPLKAICILERGEENQIRPIPAKEAVFMLLQQSNRPMDRRKLPKYMDLVDQLSRKVSFYRLQCNMNPEAAMVAYRGMAESNPQK